MGGVVDTDILSRSLQVVFHRLASPILKEFRSHFGSKEDLKKLRSNLLKMKAVLHDADKKQMTDPDVKKWLVKFNDLVYDADSVTDLCATCVGLRNQVCNFSDSSSTLSSVDNIKKYEMEPWLEKIIKKLEKLANEKDDLRLKEDVEQRLPNKMVRSKRETSSLVDESRVYGRDGDKNKIVDMLLSDGPVGEDEFGVLPIVGMGGLGKTTLAQLVYNDQRVQNHFDLNAWVCVSEETDVGIITKAILESLKIACDFKFLDPLQVELKNALNGKRFLIVLDDIWNEDPNDWVSLRQPFRSGKQGSSIIITTRNEVISKFMGTMSAYSLRVLTNEDCRSLFWQYAGVDNKYLSIRPNLKSIGEEIVKKCKGLPLAAKMLGSLLQFKVDEDEWEEILKMDIWNIPEEGENFVLSILKLSYQDLPSHLKQCFAYCSIIPKDYEFCKIDIVFMWMAEGFVHSSKGKQIEDISNNYFDDLVSRSFFQVRPCNFNNNTVMFEMHDLVHDLAQSISREACIELDGDELYNISDKAHYSSLVKKARYSSLVNGRCRHIEFDAFYDAERLRTFLPLCRPSQVVSQKIVYNLLPRWRCLRVLSLRNLLFRELPDSVINLRLLRYLNLSGSNFSMLPKSVCKLYNLQILVLDNFTKLPEDVRNLVNIRYITTYHMAPLTSFGVGKSDGSAKLGELKDLIHLTGKLHISDLKNVLDVMDAEKANLEDKQHIFGLTLQWSVAPRNIVVEEKRAAVEKVIEFLKPHKNLKELSIIYYPGICFPNWIAKLSGLKYLYLYDCRGIQVIPPLGQLPFLKHLKIRFLQNAKCMGLSECHGDGLGSGFPSLERISFDCLNKWEKWSSSIEDGQEEDEGGELFPRLAFCNIKRCPKLTGLPFYRLPSLVSLDISECRELTTLLRPKIPLYISGGGEEWFSRVEEEGEELLPCLASFYIRDCPKLTGLPFYQLPCLHELYLYNCPKLRQLPIFLTSLEKLFIENCRQVGVLPRLPLLRQLDLRQCCGKKLFSRVGPLPSLSELFISNIPRLKCLTEEFLQSLTALETLSIIACKNLLSVDLHYLSSLERVTIEKCRKVVFSVAKEEGGLPTKLQSLKLRTLNKLKSLPQMHNLTSLDTLVIRMAPRLASFPETGLPPKLRILEIGECKSLMSMPKGLHNLNCLERLKIDKCPSLESFVAAKDEEGGLFPPSLEFFHVESCRSLKELSRCEWIHHNHALLRDSTTKGCHTTIALKEIRIARCRNLESLPPGIQNLTSLEELRIMRCPRLVSFLEEGLPTTLRYLMITKCPLL